MNLEVRYLRDGTRSDREQCRLCRGWGPAGSMGRAGYCLGCEQVRYRLLLHVRISRDFRRWRRDTARRLAKWWQVTVRGGMDWDRVESEMEAEQAARVDAEWQQWR